MIENLSVSSLEEKKDEKSDLVHVRIIRHDRIIAAGG